MALVSPARATMNQTLAGVARGQFGVFTRVQALACGFTRHQITKRLADENWIVVHPKVYRISAVPLTRASAAMAGLLYAGEPSWFSHATSARLQGIDPLIPDDRTWLTVPAGVQRASRPGLVIVRSRRIEGFTDIAHDQPVLDKARTVVDLAVILPDAEYRRMLYDVFQREAVAVDDVLAAAEDFGGKVGLKLVRRAVEEYDPAFESGVEYEAGDLFQRAGLFLQRQYEVWEEGILTARLDFADEDARLGVEIDGAKFHSSPAARSYDRQRDRTLERMGWKIERFTTDDVRKRPQSTARTVRRLRDQRLGALNGAT